MKCLFLDIDGVLSPDGVNGTPEEPRGYISQRCLKVLNTWLLENPEVQIVLSSSWRHYPGMEVTREVLRDCGLIREIVDSTPYWDVPSEWKSYGETEEAPRGQTIAEYLWVHPEITNIVIIDDSHLSDMKPLCRYVVQVSSRTGLVDRQRARMSKVLSDSFIRIKV